MRGAEHHLPVLAGGARRAAMRAALLPAQVQQQRRVPQPLRVRILPRGQHLLPQQLLPRGRRQPPARHRLPGAAVQHLARHRPGSVPHRLNQLRAAFPLQVQGATTGGPSWISPPALQQPILRQRRWRAEVRQPQRSQGHPTELRVISCADSWQWRLYRQDEERVPAQVDRIVNKLPQMHGQRRGVHVRQQQRGVRL
jgi:hypothetical protein